MIRADLQYDYSGRKRKKNRVRGPVYSKMRPTAFKPMEFKADPRRAEEPVYTSAEITSSNTLKMSDEYKREVSKNYTVAPAYNKSGYQVIPNEDIKYIGRS